MNASAATSTVRLTINGRSEVIAADDTAGISDAMRRLFEARAAGLVASMERVNPAEPCRAVPSPVTVATMAAPVASLDLGDVDASAFEDDDDDDTDEIPAAPLHALRPVDIQRTTVSRSRGDAAVSSIAAARIAEQERAAAAAGFALPAPLFAAGTRVIQLGEDNFAAERQRIADLPAFDHAAHTMIGRITRERRHDITATAASLAMSRTSGRIITGTGEALTLTRDAFAQLATRAGFAAGTRYLVGLDKDRRGLNVSADLAAAGDRPVVLRTRAAERGGGREIFSVVSPAYAAVDADTVLQVAAPHLADTRGEITYDGAATVATAFWMPDHVVDLAAGDIFKAGVRVSTDDTGNGRITVQAVLFRNLCLNLIVIGEATVTTLAQVHRGDTSAILDRIGPAIVEARGLIGPFLESWGKARATFVDGDPRDVIAKLVHGRSPIAPANKGERDAAERAIVEAWHAEPGLTWADVINACTRAAHESRELVPAYRAQLERAAPLLAMDLAA